ncbi:hypothetical protein D8882_03145 [Streptococcus sanguinis]|jgi:hypothetical protein|uniref:phage tail protein n=1 Tax=Streptococcus TaxID=1301 RepID=UPI000F6875C1|nr:MULTISPECIES: phage tail protein [Streptococcus]MCY7142859.1 phage tail protein [Streptococcus gordonii]RSI19062.1 hypothetical protein D8882_03145 [Streptococcus sanguinis]DAN70923.1 MAG TPA: distal tail protein [Caudoviricetes sp.]
MIRYNELVIDGVHTSSFPFKVIVENSPPIVMKGSKTQLLEHRGINGAVMETNKHRNVMELTFKIYVVKPSEEELFQFLTLFSKEQFWLESEQLKTVRLWCYKVLVSKMIKDKHGVYEMEATFQCHPTKFFKDTDSQSFTQNGALRTKGSALAFPQLTIMGNTSTETSFTIGSQVIRLEKIESGETLVMDNNPDKPSFRALSGKRINWSGDFLTIDSSKDKTVGVVLGTGIQSIRFEIVWGWA